MMQKGLVWTAAAGLVMIAAASARAEEARPAQIDRNGVLVLIRSTLIALDQANKTGNYTVLRDLGSPAFQVNTAARLGEIFASQRRDKLDLSGVAALDPQLTLLPQIEKNGMLHMVGLFPSVPSELKFELLYAPVDGQWRLYGLSVSLAQSGPTPPEPAPSASTVRAEPAPQPQPAKSQAKKPKAAQPLKPK
jgi:hypothetical protein